jgi:hypothetical protein
MFEGYKTLLQEENVISLRTAFVVDDGSLVGFQLLPAWLDSSIPTQSGSSPKDFEWVFWYQTYLYRHMRTASGELDLMSGFPRVEQGVKPMKFECSPMLKLLWADSGNTVALYLNGEPWAFIDDESHKAYSKGILKTTVGNVWDQALFEKLFNT